MRDESIQGLSSEDQEQVPTEADSSLASVRRREIEKQSHGVNLEELCKKRDDLKPPHAPQPPPAS